jgi:hypothetical protein
MIYQAQKDVKWTRGQWISSRENKYHKKLTGKKWTEKLEEVDTDATASLSETIDQNLSDVEPTESHIFTIEIIGRCFTVNCLDL